jgi:hypothetical protein
MADHGDPLNLRQPGERLMSEPAKGGGTILPDLCRTVPEIDYGKLLTCASLSTGEQKYRRRDRTYHRRVQSVSHW